MTVPGTLPPSAVKDGGGLNIANLAIDPTLANLMPRAAVEQLQAIPIDLQGDTVTIAMLDPGDVYLIDELQRITGRRIRPIGISHQDLRTLIARLYVGNVSSQEAMDLMGDMGSKSNVVVLGSVQTSADAPTILLLNEILMQAITQRASDIHIEPYETQCLVRFRVDGILYDFQPMSGDQHIPLLSRIKILANIDIAEHRLPLDGRFSTSLWDPLESTCRHASLSIL